MTLRYLAGCHPLFVEGMGGYDTRDPKVVAESVVTSIRRHWEARPPSKPVLLMIQGDPLEPRGISAITRLVADALILDRGLIALDPAIADYHALNADRYKVVFECLYSECVKILEQADAASVPEIEAHIDALIAQKNEARTSQDKGPLADYYRVFALLQEISKAACKQLCGEMTLAHTSHKIGTFSVSSFYVVGLELGWIKPVEMAAFPVD
mmetsp:Transcript_21950/g.36758  ORF Transcript_21950/g.36758 Transcript_21950/m.36758 type:complete len:211 (-) Transcript_21950:1532-2164(-)|eukprot:CAMPEP_0174973006 /NCGR_PEP_ID=MMETSP0004_2-20121128/10980_1 /TAXON_ID=420556 /ORGANISM="Ochromonas sp., Strain CCMP1393" /LENGTH=210 /DNA_ID=CAMNT_0016223363 /DNA_START=131 /DNA_END=763 /DNA_ORIENTATION=-